jgi:isochorismate synthase
MTLPAPLCPSVPRHGEPPLAPGRAAALLASELLALGRHAPARALCAVSLPAPQPVDASARLLAVSTADRVASWSSPAQDTVLVGLGSAIELQAAGPERFTRIAAAADALFARLRCGVAGSAAPAPALRLLGGFAFAPGSASRGPWQQFGDARFTAPRWSYHATGRGAWLSVLASADEIPALHARLAAEAEALLAVLAAPLPPGLPASSATLGRLHEMPRGRWRADIETIRQAIASGRCDKIVAARASLVEADAPLQPRAVLQRLAERHPSCYQFLFGRGDTTFLGASPERLVMRRGDLVATEALAGSIDIGDGSRAAGSARAEALLASGKDRREQDFVVRAIADRLAPLCSSLDVPDEPQVRPLRHMLHLTTPITGQLRGPTHVLSLLRALHPTPAVGGVPTEAALSWIAERAPRGWYAGPVGWFDAAGDGEFAVAIRSGLLSGSRAHVYAGAGIVRDSDPDAEYAETGLKQRALLDALGLPLVAAADAGAPAPGEAP